MNRKRSLPQQAGASPEKKQKILLYLEDNTPIRTIEVSNVPTGSSDYCSKEFIRGYVEPYGPVEHVEIAVKTTSKWLENVTFVQPESADTLIHNKDVTGYARCSKFAIKIADGAHLIKIQPNVLTLEQLNDDCLLYIMSFLTVFDVINLCKTSTRMQSVGQLCSKKITKLSDRRSQDSSIKTINRLHLPVALKAIDNYVSYIDWHFLKAAEFELFVEHCPNVAELKLSFIESDATEAIGKNKGFFENLQKLYIYSSEYLFDVHMRSMMSGGKLETLDIQRCNEVRGKFITDANHDKLKYLKIINCENLKNQNLNLHEWKGKLTTFVSNAYGSYLLFLTLPTEKLERIEELYLDVSSFKGVTAGLNFGGLKTLKKLTLKNLKYSKIDWILERIGERLYEQISKHLSMLRELSIYDISMGNQAKKMVVDMIAGMPMLNYFSHTPMNWELVEDIYQTKSITALDEKMPPLRIGISKEMFNCSHKEAFEATHKGAITLCVDVEI